VSTTHIRFKVYRSSGKQKKYDVYELKAESGMTVLDALLKIKEEQDGTLGVRYSCRWSVCGSCGMLINKIPRLACRTMVSEVENETVLRIEGWGPIAKPVFRKAKGEILLEPLPNLPVVKDLIVDWRPFFEKLKKVEPWLVGGEVQPDKERLMNNERSLELGVYANCILCAVCYGSCPVVERDREYLGPAALSQAWRFFNDPRHIEKKKILDLVDSQQGIWGCDGVYNCTEVCPKSVKPTQAIMALRRNAFKYKLMRR